MEERKPDFPEEPSNVPHEILQNLLKSGESMAKYMLFGMIVRTKVLYGKRSFEEAENEARLMVYKEVETDLK